MDPRTSRESFQARIIDMRRHGGRTLFGVHAIGHSRARYEGGSSWKLRKPWEEFGIVVGIWGRWRSSDLSDCVEVCEQFKGVHRRSVHKPRHDTVDRRHRGRLSRPRRPVQLYSLQSWVRLPMVNNAISLPGTSVSSILSARVTGSFITSILYCHVHQSSRPSIVTKYWTANGTSRPWMDQTDVSEQ
jgi:hypothetical protein